MQDAQAPAAVGQTTAREPAVAPRSVASDRPAPRRGSGIGAVYWKEVADHLSGYRFLILFALVLIASLASTYVAAGTLRDTLTATGEQDRFVFLRLFTTAGSGLPSTLFFIGFLGPLLGIALGFDAINGERNRGTLSRLVSQPIYRDAIINGKFLAGLAVTAAMVFSLGFLVAGLGLRMIGVPPTFEEFLRLMAFFTVTVFYVGFWLALAILFSTVLRQTVASALASLAVWLFFTLFSSLLFGMVADLIAPVNDPLDAAQLLRNTQWTNNLNRISPAYLYEEAVQTLLNPQIRTLGPLLLEQVIGTVPGALPLGQSLLLVWPHVTALIALTLICFMVAYIAFMRQEVRPW